MMTETNLSLGMDLTGGRSSSDYKDSERSTETELSALRDVAKRMKRDLIMCKQFLEQLNEKGIVFSYAERTAASLLIEKIKRYE
jgi:NMD protein affecting ribosome stability and mRNA decay